MKPTVPVLTVAALALVAASGTAGYAGGKVTSADIRNGAVTSADVRNGSLTSADLRNGGVKAADLDPSLRPRPAIGRAYAFVTRVDSPTGGIAHVLDKNRTVGFASVSPGLDDGQPVTGIWCLTPSKGVDLRRSAIQVSTDYSSSAGVAIDALWSSQVYACKPGDVEIHTVADLGDDEPSPSDDVAFQVFAP
ncbi:hypothetical protein [Nocardioides litoris]|uniref:hypothetical protein n=1 Tax=Nocardioides litoris TaxID=1926648 RepID=UPI00111E7706|nr:hypothetical protein [Nocardioides litoris]